jgi:hypothetical protein
METPRTVSGKLRVVIHYLLRIKMSENLNWTRTFNYSRVKISIFRKKKACHPSCRLAKEGRLPVPTIEFSFFDRPARRPVNVLSGSYHTVTLKQITRHHAGKMSICLTLN